MMAAVHRRCEIVSDSAQLHSWRRHERSPASRIR